MRKTPVAPRDDAIQAVVKALPQYAEVIDGAFSQSGEFRSICEDFYACCRALDHLDKSKSSGAPAQAAEYRELHQELRQEIVTWLEAKVDLPDANQNGTPDTEF